MLEKGKSIKETFEDLDKRLSKVESELDKTIAYTEYIAEKLPQEQISKYNEFDKFQVNNNSKFIPGKWYKNVGTGTSYAKLSKLYKNSSGEVNFYIDCYIYNTLYFPGGTSFYTFEYYKNAIALDDLSEIQSFLPDGHIDKQHNFRLWKFKANDGK